MPENFVISPCQHCAGNIEFDATRAGESVACPHCGQETVLVTASNTPPILDSNIRDKSVRGTILDFTVQTNLGFISGDDGQRYSFQGTEWKEGGKFPTKGMRVDFSPQVSSACAIYLLQDASATISGTGEKRDCNHIAAALFAIFLGALGIHKFYMGKTQLGCIYIIAGVATCGWGWIITGLIGLIEGIIYLSATQAEFEQKYVFPSQGRINSKSMLNKSMLVWMIGIFALAITIGIIAVGFAADNKLKPAKSGSTNSLNHNGQSKDALVFQQGNIDVEITDIVHGFTTGESPNERGLIVKTSNFLLFTVSISNHSTNRIYDFTTFRKDALLTDDKGNVCKKSIGWKNPNGMADGWVPPYPFNKKLFTNSDRIRPQTGREDMLGFEIPDSTAHVFHLEFSAANFGGIGKINFEIPVSEISGW